MARISQQEYLDILRLISVTGQAGRLKIVLI